MRLLLPSYWWKRAFGAVIDKVDEKVEKSDLKTINGESVLGEGDLRVGVKSVESVEALEKLDAQVGDIATVGGDALRVISIGSIGKISSCDAIVSEWDNLTRIDKVEIISPYNGDKYALMWLHSKSQYGTDMIQLASSNGEIGFGRTYNNKFEEISIEEVNSLLKEKDYRALNIVGSSLKELEEAIESTFKLYIKSSSADAYIKSDSWDKLAKEYVVASESELNALDVPMGTVAKVTCKTHREIKPSSCLDSMSNWERGARITKVNLSNAPVDNVMAILYAYEGSTLIGSLGILYSNGEVICEDHKSTTLSLDELNDRLLANEYKLVGANFIQLEDFDNTFRFYTEPITDVSDAYIKGESWTRLLKEGDATGGADITNDVIISRTVYPTKSIFFGIEKDHEISETEREYNCETFRMAANNVVMLKSDTNSVAPLLELTEESATFGGFKYLAVIGPEKRLTFDSIVIDKDGNVIAEVEIAESEYLIRTIKEKAEIREFYTGDSLTDEQKAWNLETKELVNQRKCTVVHKLTKPIAIFPVNTAMSLSFFLENTFGFFVSVGGNTAMSEVVIAEDGSASATYTFQPINIKTINGESILGSGNLVISTEKYPFRIWYSYDLTPAQKEDNVRAYNALMNKETFDFELLYIDEGEDYYSISREVVTGFTCHMDSQKVHINFLVAATEDGITNESLFLTSDGTFEAEVSPL